MPTDITMPRLSDTMQQGTIVKWSVKEGQAVKSGDVLADIETDKATMELQSYDDGVVARLAVAEGQTVPVGTVIVVLAAKGEDAAAIRAAKPGATAKAIPTAPASPAGVGSSKPSAGAATAAAASSNGHNDRVFASPLARKIAAEAKLDLAAVHGSGPSGRIVRKDVEAALAGAPAGDERAGVLELAAAPAGAVRLVPLSNMRRVIARRLVESKATIPHYQVTVEVDMDPLLSLRQQLNDQLAEQGVKLSVNDFLVRACALAMRQHPYVNSRWAGAPGQEAIELLGDVNIGIAIALDEAKGGGLLVATLRQADLLGLRRISTLSRALAEKARTKGLTPEEMSDSTFTISNLGMFGVDDFTAIINPPNAAILAVGAAIEKPVVKNGQVVPGRVMSMTMSSDHRIVDGAMAAAFLNRVKSLLQSPATLLV